MKIWRRFYELLEGYRCSYIFLYGTKLSYTLLKMLMPLVLAVFVDEVLYHHNTEAAIRLAGLYAILFLAFLILSGCDVVIWQYMSNYLVVSVKNRLWQKILHLQLSEFRKYEYADLVNIIHEDARAFVRLINQNILPFINAVTTAVISILLICRFHAGIALFTLIVMPTMILLNKKWLRRLDDLSKDARAGHAALTSALLGSFSNFRDVKLLGAEHFFQNRIMAAIHAYQLCLKGVCLGTQSAEEKLRIVTAASKICIWILVALAYFRGHVSIGGYVAISQYITYAYEAFSAIFSFNFQFSQRRINLNKIFDLLDSREEPLFAGKEALTADGNIIFQNVGFSYGNRKVLEQLSFTVKRNEITGLTGKNGVGKSTVISLLVGLYSPTAGDILIGGQPVGETALKSLRQNISVVMQQEIPANMDVASYLHSWQIFLPEERIRERLYLCGFCNFLLEDQNFLSRKMSTLSGGQAQRVRIAAALMRETPVLILDEPTSMLDKESEKQVFSYLDAYKQGRIILVVAHGEKYRKYFDTIINLEAME